MIMEDDLKYGKFILQQEIDGLIDLKKTLDGNFNKAVDLLYRDDGHIILSGMGKPGHICKKIAATLSSTGNPSFYLHPSEASHGDLGVISKDDVLMVFSFSGNTSELLPMLNYANRFGIDIVAVTANPDSMLSKASTVTILIPKIEEACPNKLAPTTSTTIMAALGDAIAMCLLQKKQFKCDNFKALHPGGSLGKQLLTVMDLMHTDIPLVNSTDTMQDVIIEMTSKSFGCAGVLDNSKIVGIITDGDLRRKMSNEFLNLCAKDVMSSNPKIIPSTMLAQSAIKMMNESKITSLFIEKDMNPVGIIHMHDCLRAGLA